MNRACLETRSSNSGDAAAKESNQETAVRTAIQQFSNALDLFELDCGAYPTSEQGLQALVVAPTNCPDWKGPYLRRLENDPWGNRYRYRCPGTNSASGYDLFSPGPDRIEGTADDIGN